MVRLNEKIKTKYIIKTFLCCNKGKKFTARQITDFIVGNKLNSNTSEVHYNAISRLIRGDQYPNSVLSDVKVEKIKGRNYYYMEME